MSSTRQRIQVIATGALVCVLWVEAADLSFLMLKGIRALGAAIVGSDQAESDSGVMAYLPGTVLIATLVFGWLWTARRVVAKGTPTIALVGVWGGATALCWVLFELLPPWPIFVIARLWYGFRIRPLIMGY